MPTIKLLAQVRIRIIIICVIFIALIPLSLYVSSQEKQKAYDKYLKQGNEYLKEKFYNNAITSYQKAIITDSKKDGPYLKLAEIYSLKNNIQNEEVILEEGIKNAKDSNDLYLTLGDLLLKQARYNEALNAYLKINNQVTVKNTKLAITYYQQNQTDQALTVLDEISKDNSTDEYFYLKSLYFLFNDPKEALKILETVKFTGDLEVKTSTLKSLLKNESSDYNKLLLAKEVITQGFPAITTSLLEQIIINNPNYRDAYLVLGQAYFDSGKFSEAETTWQKAIEIDPAYGETHFLLSQLYYIQDNLQKAEEETKKATYLEPTNYRFYSFLAQIYDKQQSCDLKIQTQEKIVNEFTLWQNNQTLQENQIVLIKYYLGCNEVTKSFALSEKLKNSNVLTEKAIVVEDLYLWTRWQKNKDSNMLSAYQDYLQKFPNSVSGYYHYGKILEEQGNLTESKKEIERAYELEEPNNTL